jgi:hypothetical protein
VTGSSWRSAGRRASRAEVGRRLGPDIQTVRRFADATSIEQLLAKACRESLIDAYKAHLHQRWNDGRTDTAVLNAEIRAGLPRQRADAAPLPAAVAPDRGRRPS